MMRRRWPRRCSLSVRRHGTDEERASAALRRKIADTVTPGFPMRSSPPNQSMPALVLWMAGNAVAWALAGSSLYAFDRGGEIIAAILIGMTQGLILSQRTGTPRRWIVVQVLAWLAALLLASRHNIWGAPHPLWLGGVGGVLAGGTQCVLLTRHGDRLL